VTKVSPVSGKSKELVLLDACCLINLFATDLVTEILEALPYKFAAARYVAEEEVLEIEAVPGDEGSGGDTDRVVLRPRITELIDKGILSKLEISSSDERVELVRFAAELDDGEAETLALALTRGGRVATDDKKAIRVAEEAWASNTVSRSAPCLRTTDLIFEWADLKEIEDADLARILRDIARRASFLPPKSDPHFERWMELL
jgi:hypothetical protein